MRVFFLTERIRNSVFSSDCCNDQNKKNRKRDNDKLFNFELHV
jgi:hypothetical protein